MIPRENYFRAIGELVKYCRRSKCRDEIVALYLGGSVARGDFVPGRSDIDIYAVARDDKGGVERILKGAARRIASESLRELFEIHREPLGITVTTIEEVRSGSSFLGTGFEYATSWAQESFSSDARSGISSPCRAGKKKRPRLSGRWAKYAGCFGRDSVNYPRPSLRA